MACNSCRFGLVLAVNAVIALVLFIATSVLVWLIFGVEARPMVTQPAE